MKIFKDKKIVALVAVIMLFTIVYFVGAIKFSYAFENNIDLNVVYAKRLETIKKCAIAYGKNNLDQFKENDTIYIKVQDLIDNNYLIPDENGNVNNPIKKSEILNENVISIKKNNDTFKVEIDS